MNGVVPSDPVTDGGTLPAGVPVVQCPLRCPTDFVLDAPCRIVRCQGGQVSISAQELPGCSGGSFAWTSTSTKLRLLNATGSTLSVEALADPSSARDAEVITCTRTGVGCTPVAKTVALTVARVRFSAAAAQRYGYDDFDTPANFDDDHLCVKKSDHTFVHVQIDGGALGTDFDFVCDPADTATPVAPGGQAAFDLRLNAGAHDKQDGTLHARVKCTSAESFAHLALHVYKERFVEVVVAKMHDSTSAGTALNYGNADYAAHTATINGKLKEAVVRFDITNYAAGNAQTDVRYDLDNNGVLSYDIASGGGRELTAIAGAMTGTGTKTRIAVVRDMKSFYYLANAARRGDRTVTVTAGSVFGYPAGSFPLGTGAGAENVSVASSAGSVITLGGPLTKDHAAGESLEFPAGGWGSDPIIIIEGRVALDVVKWTIAHEAGHRALNLRDVVDRSDFMHWVQEWTDYRLRYCPRTKKHVAGTENQWDTIPRT
jgi:hypothetical protein